MMQQRFKLFHAGYTASLPGLYFSKQKIKESFLLPDDVEIQKNLTNYFKTFEEEKSEHISHLVIAVSLADYFEIKNFETPHTSLDYFKWHDEFIHEFESKFPMARIEHYYFLYARRIAELLKNMGLINTYVDIQLMSKKQLDFSSKIEVCIKDSEFILFKLMAPTALLSSEPSQSCFNMLYKQLREEIQVFKEVDVVNADKEELLKLKKSAENFSIVLLEGYKKCSAVLQEL